MSNNIDPFVVGRVIGDVVDVFVPSVGMSVYYGTKHITNGCTIKPSICVDPPQITITANPNLFYTLVMVDPDAPSPSEPTMREWVHWLVTDIPGSCTVIQGNTVIPYVPPQPPIGIHRYILVLFQQRSPIGPLQPPATRANFNTRMFANYFNMNIPVAVVYFHAQREPLGRRR